MEMTTDLPTSFEKSNMKMCGYDMTKLAASRLFGKTQFKPAGLYHRSISSCYVLRIHLLDVDVIELHDCFSANELITYESLGLCEEGKAGEMIDRGDNTYGGKYVVNPSGGLISKGHPLGATGMYVQYYFIISTYLNLHYVHHECQPRFFFYL